MQTCGAVYTILDLNPEAYTLQFSCASTLAKHEPYICEKKIILWMPFRRGFLGLRLNWDAR